MEKMDTAIGKVVVVVDAVEGIPAVVALVVVVVVVVVGPCNRGVIRQ